MLYVEKKVLLPKSLQDHACIFTSLSLTRNRNVLSSAPEAMARVSTPQVAYEARGRKEMLFVRVKKGIYSSLKTCPGGSQELLAEVLSRVPDFAGVGKESHFIILAGKV